MGDILAFVEQRDGELSGVSREVVSVAAQIAAETGARAHALLVGGGEPSGAAGLGAAGADSVRVAFDSSLASYAPDAFARVIADAARDSGAGVVVFAATAQGRDLAPRVAALLDVPLATDVTGFEVEGEDIVLTRPVYAGKAFARVRLQGSPTLFSIRPNVFQAREWSAAGTVEAFQPDVAEPRVRTTGFEAAGGGTVDVAQAATIVSGGRGMKDPSHWNLLEDLRDALGPDTALGASRAVVDAGWRPHGEQVGQTGKTVAPKLYFAVGISGAIQHLAGMRTAQTIVAINKDPDAPIFGVADYGVVGDLFEIVPRLVEEVRSLRSG